MGRRFSEVQEEIKTVPYRVVADQEGNARVDIRGKQYTPAGNFSFHSAEAPEIG